MPGHGRPYPRDSRAPVIRPHSRRADRYLIRWLSALRPAPQSRFSAATATVRAGGRAFLHTAHSGRCGEEAVGRSDNTSNRQPPRVRPVRVFPGLPLHRAQLRGWQASMTLPSGSYKRNQSTPSPLSTAVVLTPRWVRSRWAA